MSIIDRARALRGVIEQMSGTLDDAAALGSPELFPAWREGVAYTTGQRVRHDGTLYKVLQEHTAQADWSPAAAPSLFAKVLIPDPETIPAWEQPDSTNPYSKGDKVTHNGKTWVSYIDGNVWEPGVYGWTETDAPGLTAP